VPLPPAREVPKAASVACDPFATENTMPTRRRSLRTSTSGHSQAFVALRRRLLDFFEICSFGRGR
jgi:hypothetical protein